MFFHLLLVCAVVSSNILSVLGQWIYCDDAFQCVGQSVVSNNIQVAGYKSAWSGRSSITAIGKINIYGSFGAYKTGRVRGESTSTTKIVIEGGFGGMKGLYDGNFGIYGLGVGSLAQSDVFAATPYLSWLTCSGSMACSETTMGGGTGPLTCLGSQDCQFMTIQTVGAGQNLKFEGIGHYSLYGSIIICQSGDSCTFKCYGAACFGAYFICKSGSNCVIQTLYPANNDYYPLTDLNDPLPDIPEFEKNWDFDIITQGLNNDANCNLDIATTFDVE